jgi:hypothetical protein
MPDGTTIGDPQELDFRELPTFTTRLTAAQVALLSLPSSKADVDMTAYYRPGAKVSESILGRALGFTLTSSDGDEVTAAVAEPVYSALLWSELENKIAKLMRDAMKEEGHQATKNHRITALAAAASRAWAQPSIEGASEDE